MEGRPLIFVLVCTIDDGIQGVPQVLLSEEEGVKYVVSWQQTQSCGEYPVALKRSDVYVASWNGHGLSRNRNHAMDIAMSKLRDPLEDVVFVIADDDERLDAQAFPKIRDLYSRQPKLDVALWRMVDIQDGHLLKEYPVSAISYHRRPRSYYASSVEMTFRSRLYLMGLRFDERFGLGSEKLSAGEEDVFLTDVLRLGLRVWIYPKILCSTSSSTTGSFVLDVKVLRSKGAVYGYRHCQLWAFIRSLKEAFSLAIRYHRSFLFIFRNIWYGVKYIRQ